MIRKKNSLSNKEIRAASRITVKLIFFADDFEALIRSIKNSQSLAFLLVRMLVKYIYQPMRYCNTVFTVAVSAAVAMEDPNGMDGSASKTSGTKTIRLGHHRNRKKMGGHRGCFRVLQQTDSRMALMEVQPVDFQNP